MTGCREASWNKWLVLLMMSIREMRTAARDKLSLLHAHALRLIFLKLRAASKREAESALLAEENLSPQPQALKQG